MVVIFMYLIVKYIFLLFYVKEFLRILMIFLREKFLFLLKNSYFE
jgi:hypothetical protein